MLPPEQVKACCADVYASPAARWLLGGSLHPGGAKLTSRLVAALETGPGDLVADVACGPGAGALQLVRETGCDVVGIDLSPVSVEVASTAAAEAGLAARATFLVGDAEALPLPDASVDGVLCECALCTFPDKERAAAEIARVLRPGARLALADVTADPQRLPPELSTLEAWVACLGGARPREELAALLAGAGLEVEDVQVEDDALAELLRGVEERLRPLGIGLDLVAAAGRAVVEGALGYAVLYARRPADASFAPERRVAASNRR